MPHPTRVFFLFMTTVSCHKAQVISNWLLEYDNELTVFKWPPESPDPNPVDHLCDVVKGEIYTMNVQLTNLRQLCDALTSISPKIFKKYL